MFRRLLVPVDLTPKNVRAVEAARDLATQSGGEVFLLHVIETLDRPKLAHSLAREMDKQGRRPLCFVEVNTGEEPQKSGILPGEADAFVKLAREELGLPVEGLMCIPPQSADPEDCRPYYRRLAEIHRRIRDVLAEIDPILADDFVHLSMGMSQDADVGVEEGATLVRVGRAIFGPRPSPAVAQEGV